VHEKEGFIEKIFEFFFSKQ